MKAATTKLCSQKGCVSSIYLKKPLEISQINVVGHTKLSACAFSELEEIGRTVVGALLGSAGGEMLPEWILLEALWELVK